MKKNIGKTLKTKNDKEKQFQDLRMNENMEISRFIVRER